MKKKKEYKSLTHALKNLRTGKDFNQFQITSSRKWYTINPSLNNTNGNGSSIRAVQASLDEDVIKPFIKEILNYPVTNAVPYNHDTVDENFMNKLIEAFKKSGFEAEECTMLNDTWIWLRIPDTNYDKLEEQLNIVASNLE